MLKKLQPCVDLMMVVNYWRFSGASGEMAQNFTVHRQARLRKESLSHTLTLEAGEGPVWSRNKLIEHESVNSPQKTKRSATIVSLPSVFRKIDKICSSGNQTFETSQRAWCYCPQFSWMTKQNQLTDQNLQSERKVKNLRGQVGTNVLFSSFFFFLFSICVI